MTVPSGSGPIFLNDVACSGAENSLITCNSLKLIGINDWTHSGDVGVHCEGRCNANERLVSVMRDRLFMSGYIRRAL